MGIYSRDNLADSLASQLENALKRRQMYVENDAKRRMANVEAINKFVKSAAYAAESDDLNDRLAKLKAERESMLEAQQRSQGMPKTGITPSGLPSNGPGIAAEQSAAMKGYVPYKAPSVTLPRYSGEGRYPVDPTYPYDYFVRSGRAWDEDPKGTEFQEYLREMMERGRMAPSYLDVMLNREKGIY